MYGRDVRRTISRHHMAAASVTVEGILCINEQSRIKLFLVDPKQESEEKSNEQLLPILSTGLHLSSYYFVGNRTLAEIKLNLSVYSRVCNIILKKTT